MEAHHLIPMEFQDDFEHSIDVPENIISLCPTDMPEVDESEKPTYYRAEVHLSEGGQNYDIMGWSKISVINDVIDQFHKHQHFIHLLK